MDAGKRLLGRGWNYANKIGFFFMELFNHEIDELINRLTDEKGVVKS